LQLKRELIIYTLFEKVFYHYFVRYSFGHVSFTSDNEREAKNINIEDVIHLKKDRENDFVLENHTKQALSQLIIENRGWKASKYYIFSQFLKKWNSTKSFSIFKNNN
jgi:hypothetical protein